MPLSIPSNKSGYKIQQWSSQPLPLTKKMLEKAGIVKFSL